MMPRRLAFALSLVACVLSVGGAAVADSLAGKFPVGSAYQGQVQFGRILLPLPPGSWVVSSFNETRNNGNGVVASMTLASIVDNTFRGYIEAQTSVDPSSYGWVANKHCSRKDVFFRQTDAEYQFEQACWGISHVVTAKTSAYTPGYGKNIHLYLRDAGITMPRTMIATMIHLAGRSHFVTYTIYLAPTYAGFADDAAAWRDNSWHKDLVTSDPRKLAFLEQVKTQHAPIYAAMHDGFHFF